MKTFILFTMVFAVAAIADSGKYEISKYRFSKKSGMTGERLVLEFATRNKGQKPHVKTVFNSDSKVASIQIDNAVLTGAVPEAMINDTYLPKSHYLGNMNINTDDKEGFSIKVALKKSAKNVDAFWIDGPARLVLDISNNAGYAKMNTGKVFRGTASEGGERQSSKGGKVLCFHADSQVTAAIAFDKKPSVQSQNNANMDGIVCYPTAAMVDVSVTFLNKTGQVWNQVNEPRRETTAQLMEQPAAAPMLAPPPMPAAPQQGLLAPPPASSALLPPPAPSNGSDASASPMLLAPPPAN